jgi:hypothetical protein
MNIYPSQVRFTVEAREIDYAKPTCVFITRWCFIFVTNGVNWILKQV